MTSSRRSSLSLAQPIQMPDDTRDVGHNDNDSHRIQILLNPSDQHVINCNGDTAMADVPLQSDGDDGDKNVHVNTVL